MCSASETPLFCVSWLFLALLWLVSVSFRFVVALLCFALHLLCLVLTLVQASEPEDGCNRPPPKKNDTTIYRCTYGSVTVYCVCERMSCLCFIIVSALLTLLGCSSALVLR